MRDTSIPHKSLLYDFRSETLYFLRRNSIFSLFYYISRRIILF